MPSIDIGGVEKNFIIISNYLSKKFKNISVITTSNDKRGSFIKNIKFISYDKKFIKNFPRRVKFFFALILLFKELFNNRKNIVLCFQANIYCVYLCKLMKTKVIIRSNSSPTGWSKNIFKNIVYKNAYQAADSVIVNSIEFAKIMKNKFNINSKCIYNPLDKVEILKKSKKKIKFKFFDKKSLNFVSVARFENQKDHHTLLKAFKDLSNNINLKLLLIGWGSGEKEIRTFILENRLSNKIKILNQITNPFPFILKSDFFVHSSKFEGLPNVLLESIVLKRYVISSDCPTGPKEILSYGKGGTLFKTGNHLDLKNKIIELIKDKKDLKKKITFSFNKLNRFDQNKNLKKYYDLIDKL